mgnify:CR=1 FL=1
MAKTVANTTKQEKFPDFTFFSCWYKIRNMQQNKMRIVALRVLLHSLVYKEESTDMRKSILPVGGKFMEHITLFTDILPEEQERMRVCFHAREMTFRNGETIMEYSSSMKKIGLILYGRAVLNCCDAEGNQHIIDELNKDAVFGEPFLLPTDSQHYYVCATEETRVMFIDYEHVIKRCEQACHHHSQMVSNLLQLTAIQSRQLNERIYILSRSSTRKKLMAYLNALSTEKHSKDLKLPMSYTALAQYLSVDRSAMTRELKNLEEEGIIKKSGKQIHII